MAVETQIQRLQTARNDIRNKLVELSLVEDTARLDDLALAVQNIKNNGDVDAEVKEGETFTIPAGYHNGSGTVKGVAGGGNYILQTKTVTPTKEQQSVTPDQGKYGLSSVTVNAIPAAYQNVTDVTATAADVLTGKVIVDAAGRVVTGGMPNNGAVSQVIDMDNREYTIPKGYHNGSGTVKIVPEFIDNVMPTKDAQHITPSAGKVIEAVYVDAIPDKYQDITVVTATANKVLTGSKFVGANGAVTDGAMPNNGAVKAILDTDITENNVYTIPAGYHNGSGTVSINVEGQKVITPTKSTQYVAPESEKVLSTVKVNPIPDAYQDVTNVTATASAVLEGHDFVDSAGKVVEGTMLNRGKITATINGLTSTTCSYTIPKGYHDGTGTISLTSDIETMLAAI